MRFLITTYTLLVLSLFAQGQQNSKLITNSLFENYSVSNGLLDEKIHCVFQDSKGWIWLGTDYGAYRFDGYSFTSFDLNDELSIILSNALIRVIYEAPQGIIWIGTDFQGLFKYDISKNVLEQFKDKGFTHNSVWAILADEKQNLWLGTEGGLNYFNTSTNQIEQTFTVTSNQQIPGNWVRKLFFDHQKNLWVGTNKGIAIFDTQGRITNSYLTDNRYIDRENEVWEIYQDNTGTIWIGTYLGGLFYCVDSTRNFRKFELDKANNRTITVRSIIQDSKGNLWFGTRGGLYSLNPFNNNLKQYQNEQNNNYSLIHNSVLDLFIDKKGDLWVGTRNGLSFLNFDKQSFGYLKAAENKVNVLNNGEVYVFWEDDQQKLWMGTESGGINIFDAKHDHIKYLTVKDGLSSNCIKAICPDNYGNILIGTYLGGLNLYNTKTGKVKVFKHNQDNPASICDNEVWAIVKDSKNRIWVGTSNGIDIYNDKTQSFEHFGDKYGIGWVAMIYEDSRHNFWLYAPDVEQMFVVKNNQEVIKLDIQSRAMCEDINGNYWLATLGHGLIKLNQQFDQMKQYSVNEGISNNIMNGIININNEYLWISSNNGLSRFNFKTNEIKNYFSSDGLLNNKFNYGAFYKTSENLLAFGGNLGVDFIYLDRINQNEYIPPIVLTSLKVYNKKIEQSKEGILTKHISETRKIILKHDQNMFSFDFAALNYANSNKNKYKYKLEGFDKDWNDIGTSRVATYTNIEQGEYVFRVIGSNNDNVFNEQGVKLDLIILPPFWKTWWFRLLAIAFLALFFVLILLMIRNREKLKQELVYERRSARKIQEVDRLKHQFFMNISHEIRTPLSLIIGPVDKLLNEKNSEEVVSKNLEIIKRNTTNLNRLVNQLLDYRKLETGNLKLELRKGNLRIYIEEIVDSFRTAADDKEINLEFNAYQPSIFFWFDADKVEKIINNLLSNAIKYTSEKGHISVSISMVFASDIEDTNLLIPPIDAETIRVEKYVKISVSDTGVGIAPENISRIFDRFRRIGQPEHEQVQGSGIGLALTKELTKLHAGHIEVKSKLGKGSRFSVYLPFDDHGSIDSENHAEEIDFHEPPNAEQINKNTQLLALVVDDNPDLREFIKTHFVPEYAILEAKNGKEAWDLALEKIPDIIVADVMMPGIDGNELCKRLKHDERTSHIPVIMLSALTTAENQLAGIDAGADDYITKPFDVGLLKAKVDNLLSIRKALRERYSKEMILKPTNIILAAPDEKFLKRLISVIEKNISKEFLDVEFLSQNMDVSRTQLYRKVGALTDMTPKEFVKEIRMKRAAQLIVQNKLNISEVSYEVGFSDISYFRKCFREKFGMSASEYKKKYVQ
jgi:signal transduction histidine kinase/ligand-binding sensor domain-containing protein/DNA-binding response OmpR family regulator